MYVKLDIDNNVTEYKDISYKEALKILEKLENTNPDFFDLQFEDVDSSFMQFMKENGIINVCVSSPVSNNQLLCRYAPYDYLISFTLLEDAIDDFFNGNTDMPYFEWDDNLDDYIEI